MTFIQDKNGNIATITRWGSEEAARASLLTLRNCRNCRDCSRCSDCSGCSGCSYCSDCSGCSYCSRCSDCSGCSGCSGCSDCWDCSDCSGCSRCSYCWDCSYCSYCSGCLRVKQLKNRPIVVGPFRSDGYQFVIAEDGGVRAGCRVFVNFAEARKHWTKTRGGTPLGEETMRILDWCEAEYKARKQNA